MTDIVIKAENLGKRYTIGHQTGKGDRTTFREALSQNAQDLWHKTRDLARGKPVIQGNTQEEVWALKDVSFEVHRGEAVGIIGRNGAGKSTLLKILSRITEPTEGRVTIRGRVASLLEVGTGFHSELTGRENIYLNGAILGMTRAEIRRKFDEIVAFAEVEKYLDTPVKRYSSGMYVRLAFAVAAHLEPEILVVDEVLAVGDAEFQKKCLGKMDEVAKQQGRTVLFVSHNMAAIKALCSESILLRGGKKQMSGPAQEVVSEYENLETINAQGQWENSSEIYCDKTVKLQKIEIVDKNNQGKASFLSSEPVFLKFTVAIYRPDENLKIGFDMTKDGIVVFRSHHVDVPHSTGLLSKGTHTLICIIPPDLLMDGDYFVAPVLSIHFKEWIVKDSPPLVRFNVVFDNSRSFFHLHLKGSNQPGVIFPQLEWKQE
jgi:lipopolysaccharide transport system ATP-binding protein